MPRQIFMTAERHQRIEALAEKRSRAVDIARVLSPVLTTPEAAAYCKVSESYLKQSRMKEPPKQFKTQPPRHIKRGRSVVYLRADLDEWLQNLATLSNNEDMEVM